jgi:hypothetical protein
LKKSALPSTPVATYMIRCEAREWHQRYRAKVKQLGSVRAQSWWHQVKTDIVQIRGQAIADILINEMNRQQHEKRSKN